MRMMLSALIVCLPLAAAGGECRTYQHPGAENDELELITIEPNSISVEIGAAKPLVYSCQQRLCSGLDWSATSETITYQLGEEIPGQFATINGERWEPACD